MGMIRVMKIYLADLQMGKVGSIDGDIQRKVHLKITRPGKVRAMRMHLAVP